MNQARATGLPGRKKWLAVRSYRTRPEHRHVHNQEADLNGTFEVAGWPMDRPHDPTAPPDLVMGCRCGLGLEFDTADVLLGPNPQRAQADQRLLKEVWDAGLVRQGITQEDLASLLLDLGLTASVTIPVAGSPEETTMEAAVAVTVTETDTEGAEVLARKTEDDDCPPGQVWDADEEECVDLPGEEELAAKDAETAGGPPNPGTGKDGRKKGRKGPERRKRSTSAATESKIEPTGEGRFEAILVVEGIPTGDGREFAPESLSFADFPLPLTYQPPTHGGEPGPAIDVGVIEEGWRDETNPRLIRGRGRFDMQDPAAADIYRKVEEKLLRGTSVDVDDIDPYTDVELIWPESAQAEAAGEGDEDSEPDDLSKLFMPPSKRIFHKGRIRGAAVLSMPAFVEAQLWAEGTEAPPLPDLAALEASARLAEETQEAKEKEHRTVTALTAAAVARLDDHRPPADWFQNPQLGQHTPIIVTDDLRVYGHAFTWDQCHIGYGDVCVTPPEEEDFPFYTQGTVVCAGGERIPVGAITLGMGHASTARHVSPRAAAEHYDNTDAVVADVAIGCDRVGGWVAGCIRPGTDPKKVYALRASGQVSGDWRMIGDRLRLVALLTVNVPGFPVPRPEARVAGGQVVAMTAAGMLNVGPRVDWQYELEQLALKLARDKALASVNDEDDEEEVL